MLYIDHPERDIPEQRFYNPKDHRFITIPPIHYGPVHLKLEHSLMSVARWEGLRHVPFLEKNDMTTEEFLDYIRCMCIDTPKDPAIFDSLTTADFQKIVAYMRDEKSARVIRPKPGGKAKYTAENLYYAMIRYGIPFDPCEKWHFNRLLALIDICACEGGNGGPDVRKMSQAELLRYYNELNERHKKELGTRG